MAYEQGVRGRPNAPDEPIAYDEAEKWMTHHYYEHDGEFEDCTSSVCRIVLARLTEPNQ